MNCPKCNIEMTHGQLVFGASVWRKAPEFRSKLWRTWPWVKDKNYNMHAYRCSNCGKIELTSDLEGI